MKREGFENIMEAHVAAVAAFEESLKIKREGICAQVKIQIVQDLVLTRQGFEAKLELDNDAEAALTNITLVFRIRRTGETQLSNSVFAIGQPTMQIITGSMNGTGRLESGSTGTATWLMIPRREAAPTAASVDYDIGGELRSEAEIWIERNEN